MDLYTYEAPFSLIVAYLILFSNYVLGHYILSIQKINVLLNKISNLFFQKILFGQLTLMIVLFIFIIFFDNAKFFYIVFYFINIVCCIHYIFFFFKKKKIINLNFLENKNFHFYLFSFLILLFFLLSSSPITDADSLDYHFGAALNILKYDKFFLNKEWFTLAQSGRGEILIGYGLLLGSEQYSSLIQFSGLLSICGILIKISEINLIFKNKYFLSLIVITCPVLLFLVNSAKPQLFFSACLLIAIALCFENNFNKNLLKIFTLINILIFVAMTGKFSFQLSGFLIWCLAFLRFVNLKNLFQLLTISILVFIIIYLPYIYWKWDQYGGNILSYFLNPLPIHLSGYNNFFEHIKAPQGFGLNFPYFLLITNSLSRITETLGFSSLIFMFIIFCKKEKEAYQILLIIIIFTLVANSYSSPSARYFFDCLLWLAFCFKFIKRNIHLNFLNLFFYIQFFLIFIILIYSSINFFRGSLSPSSYINVKNKYAYDYSAIKWLNDKLKSEDALVFTRSISHSGNYTSGIFLNFTSEENLDFYINIIKEKKIKYYATFGTHPRLSVFENCLEGLYLMENNVGNTAFRNPFAKKNTYNGYIYYLNYEKLPNCVK